MLHSLLFILLFALLPLAGRGQAAPARSAASPPDSIAAIKRLFRQQRQCSGFGLAVGCGAVAPGASAGEATQAASQLMLPPGAVAGLGMDRSLLSCFSLMRFSCRREQRMLRRLALHRPLPGYVQRALNPVLASN